MMFAQRRLPLERMLGMTKFAVSALRNSVALRDPAGTIVHSNRGSEFRSHAFVRTLKDLPFGGLGR